MKSQVLVRRYAQGLANALKDESEFRAVSRELQDMIGVLEGHGGLKKALTSPFVAKNAKARIIQDILKAAAYSPKATRFLLLLMEKDRLEILEDITVLLPVLWNERQGVLTFEVFSAVPLTEGQKNRLKESLETAERKPVSLTFSIDPELIAGLTVRKGNLVYDVSLKGHLMSLKDMIIQG